MILMRCHTLPTNTYALSACHQVYGLPAIILIKDGQLVAGSKREGAFTKAVLTKWLKDNGVDMPAA